jgi:hypothetical protein
LDVSRLALLSTVAGPLLVAVVISRWEYYSLIGLLAVIGVMAFILVAIAKPSWIFYVFMGTFVVGEIGVKLGSLPKASLSNFLLVLAVFVMVVRSPFDRSGIRYLSANRRKVAVLVLSLLLLVHEAIASAVNREYGFVTTRIGYLLVPLLIFYIVRSKRILVRGLLLSIWSAGGLAFLTILRSLGVSPLGYRATWNWGTAPWEAFLPRAIGLPQMDGGQHGVFIVSMLGIALVLSLKGAEIGLNRRMLFPILILTSLGAIGISVYRSAWLGAFATLAAFALLGMKMGIFSARHTLFGFGVIALVSLAFISSKYSIKDLSDYLYHLAIEVRQQGVQLRLSQYTFTIHKVFGSVKGLAVGFGHQAFDIDFYNEFANSWILQNDPKGLHNHFLGYLYSAGLPSLVIYLVLLGSTIGWLYSDLNRGRNGAGIISLGLLCGFVGALVILNFTVRLAGYKIIWAISGIAALLPELYGNPKPQGHKNSIVARGRFSNKVG